MQVITNILSTLGRTGLVLQKHAPTIAVVAGTAGLLGAGVTAAIATRKLDDVVDEHQDRLLAVSDTKFHDEKERQKALTKQYFTFGIELAKLYGPSVSLAALSIFLIGNGYKIMHGRNVAMAAAYKALERGFTAYRQRVVEEHGEEHDYQYRHGLKKEEIVEMVADEKGKEKAVKKEVYTPVTDDFDQPSIYARWFDETCSQWSSNQEYNHMFLLAQQKYANNLLIARGHVFLNDVYDLLGIPRSSEASVVGWTHDGEGDGHIDFGIFNGLAIKNREFVNGHINRLLLDFNVDGLIYDQI